MLNSKQFIRLLSADHYTKDELQEVNDICRSYPMFNLAHMLKVRIMEKLSLENESELHLAAVYTSDRRRLFEFVSPGQRQTQYTESGTNLGREDLQFSYGDHMRTDMIISIDDGPLVLSDPELLEIDPSAEDGTLQIESVEDETVEDETAEDESIEDEKVEDDSIEDEKLKDDSIVDETEESESEEKEDDLENLAPVGEKQEVDMEEPEESDDSGFPSIDVMEESDVPDEDSVEEGSVEKGSDEEGSNEEGSDEKDTDEEDSDVGDSNGEIGESGKSGNLIERFINKDPGAIRADALTSLKGDASVDSIKENDHLITDTLAKIYVKQGLHTKAIYSYEKLSLKFPEKSAYFAAQIEKIENITNS